VFIDVHKNQTQSMFLDLQLLRFIKFQKIGFNDSNAKDRPKLTPITYVF